MASVSLIEGIAKKFLNLVPRPFYTEAAQKLVYEICETIYKELENNGDRIPRSEIIQIVEDFVTTHLNNPPQNPNENPMGIRDAISDSLKRTTLEVYKDEKINMLLLQQILSEENGADGIFYKSLEQSIKNTNDPDYKNSANDNKKDKNDDSNKEKKDTDKDSEKFAKKVVNELVNTTVEIPIIKGGGLMDQVKNAVGDAANAMDSAVGDAANAMDSIKGNITGAMDSITSDNPLLAGALASAGSGSGNQPQITNIGYEENKNGVLPYIQTNCNGVGLGLPGIDLDFLAKIFDGLKEPIAEELVKKIQERLPDKTSDSFTVKAEIYEKILLVIQAHLQSKEGKDMLLGHINETIKPEIEKLTASYEIKKRLLNVIFKDKNSEIYKKLIEIIARHSKLTGIVLEQKNQENGNATIQEDKSKGGAPNEKDSKSFQVTTIEEVIQEFSEWLNEKIGSTQQSVIENPVGGQTNKANQELQHKLSLADVVTVNSKKNIDGEETSVKEIGGNENSISMPSENEMVTSNNNSVEIAKGNETAVDGGTITESSNLQTDTKSEDAKLSNENVETSTLPFKGGKSNAKNKTKKRRTKNNKRKTSKNLKNKQKIRVTKKKNRKHNQNK